MQGQPGEPVNHSKRNTTGNKVGKESKDPPKPRKTMDAGNQEPGTSQEAAQAQGKASYQMQHPSTRTYTPAYSPTSTHDIATRLRKRFLISCSVKFKMQ